MGWTEEQVEAMEDKLQRRVQKLAKAFRIHEGKNIFLRSKISQAQSHLEALRAAKSSLRPSLAKIYESVAGKWTSEIADLKKEMKDVFDNIKAKDSSQDELLRGISWSQTTFPDWETREVAARINQVNDLDSDRSQLEDQIGAHELEYLEFITARVRNLTDRVRQTGEAVYRALLKPGGPFDQHDRAITADLIRGLDAARKRWMAFIEQNARPLADMETAVPGLVASVTTEWARIANDTAGLSRAQRNDTATACRAVWALTSQSVVDAGRGRLLWAAVQRLGDGRRRMADPCAAARAVAVRVDALVSLLLERLAAAALDDAEAGRGAAAAAAEYYNKSAALRVARWRGRVLDTAAAVAAHRRRVEAAAVEGGVRILGQVGWALACLGSARARERQEDKGTMGEGGGGDGEG